MTIKAQFSITLSRVDDGQDGKQGAAGVGVKSSVVTYQGSTSGTSTPIGTWLTSIPTVAAGSYLWTRTITTMTDGTSSTAYSVALQGKTGGTGPKGSDITSYSSGTTLPTSVAVANSQFWLLNSSGTVQKVYKSNGTKWIELPISASMINAATFNGFTFNGVHFNASDFTASGTDSQGGKYVESLDSAGLSMIYQYKNASGALVQRTTKVSNTGAITSELAPVITGGLGKATSSMALQDGSLTLQNGPLNSNTTGGQLTAQMLRILETGYVLAWSGTVYPSNADTLTMSIPLSQTVSGWLLVWDYFRNGTPQNDKYNYTLLPKAAAKTPNNRIDVSIGQSFVGSYTKVLYFTDTIIKGDVSNNVSSNTANAVIRWVYAV